MYLPAIQHAAVIKFDRAVLNHRLVECSKYRFIDNGIRHRRNGDTVNKRSRSLPLRKRNNINGVNKLFIDRRSLILLQQRFCSNERRYIFLQNILDRHFIFFAVIKSFLLRIIFDGCIKPIPQKRYIAAYCRNTALQFFCKF